MIDLDAECPVWEIYGHDRWDHDRDCCNVCWSNQPGGKWQCTRVKHHNGDHIAFLGSELPDVAWFNDAGGAYESSEKILQALLELDKELA